MDLFLYGLACFILRSDVDGLNEKEGFVWISISPNPLIEAIPEF